MSADKNRINIKLELLRKKNEKALVCFLTAGFPKINATVPLVKTLEQGGADIIELGMPFSDPLADGHVIQQSSQIALKHGITLDIILKQVKQIRKGSNIPIVLMGYLNPILTYGAEKFFKAASKAGVEGMVLPELPFEESGRFKSLFESSDLANILLVTPTTPVKRVAMIDQASNGFLYCVSTTGVTGSGGISMNSKYIDTVKKSAKKNPVLVGFGIKTPEDAKRIAQHADGVIVGSALIDRVTKGESLEHIRTFVRQLKDAL
jgi:tryptophan synthase alpha chain